MKRGHKNRLSNIAVACALFGFRTDYASLKSNEGGDKAIKVNSEMVYSDYALKILKRDGFYS